MRLMNYMQIKYTLLHTLQATANQRTYYLCKLKFRFGKSRLQIYASSISENYTKLSLFFNQDVARWSQSEPPSASR